jgi:hypothetical protein
MTRKCHVRFCSRGRGREAPPYRNLGGALLAASRSPRQKTLRLGPPPGPLRLVIAHLWSRSSLSHGLYLKPAVVDHHLAIHKQCRPNLLVLIKWLYKNNSAFWFLVYNIPTDYDTGE